MRHEKTPGVPYFPVYWLFNRDPYFMVYYNPIYLGSISSPINPKQPVFFFRCSNHYFKVPGWVSRSVAYDRRQVPNQTCCFCCLNWRQVCKNPHLLHMQIADFCNSNDMKTSNS